jgi:hypothetical protein
MIEQPPPGWGEPGYQPPGELPPRLRPPPTRAQRRLLWGMLAASLVGFAVYFLAIVGGPGTPAPAQVCAGPLFVYPVLAAVSFTLMLAAVVPTWLVYRRVTAKLATVILPVTIGVCGFAALMALGGACW